MNPDTILLLLLSLPFVAAPVIYIAGRASVRSTGSALPARWLGLITFLGMDAYFINSAITFGLKGPILTSVGAITLKFDGISLLLGSAVLLLGTLAAIFSFSYIAGNEGEEKFYSLLVAMCGAMIGLGCANDLFNLWIWFEAMAASSYLLVAFYNNQPGSLEAGLKYLVQSAVGSALVLMGISLVFTQTGLLNLDRIRAYISEPTPMLLAAGTLFLIGFGVKTAMVPMHTWLPDAHSMAPSGISAMLSGVVIEAGLVAMLRSLGVLFGIGYSWGIILLVFGGLNILAGNLIALRQTQVKRMLAFSSLAHVGYIILGIGVAVTFNNAASASGGFFHLFNHAIMKSLAFLSAGAVLYALYIRRGSHGPLVVSDLNGLSKRYPLVALAFSIAVLALGGLPPLSGFMSKWQIFVGGFETKNTAVIVLMIFAGLNSVLSLGYYAPLVNRMYRLEPSEAVVNGKSVNFSIVFPLLVLAAVVVILGFYPSLMSEITSFAGSSLLEGFGLK